MGTEKNGRYYGKLFSILGDSISTLHGYNPAGYKVFYEADKCEKSGVRRVEDTWWGKVIEHFGGKLLVNNSWSGSRVVKLVGRNELFPSGCSDERTSRLHIDSVVPDIIIVYLGTNDWAFGVKTSDYMQILGEDENEIFEQAYQTMLRKLRHNYPRSEIWCCTLNETFMSGNPAFSFPHEHAGTHIEVYNEIIREAAFNHGCSLIDLYACRMPYDSIDGSHPNLDGMKTLAEMIIREMEKKAKSITSFKDTVVENRYKILALAGTGGQSAVYLVLDEHTDQRRGMKICNKASGNHRLAYQSNMVEAYMMMKMNHPAIPYVIDFFEDEKYVYIVQEYIEGKDLKTFISENGAQTQERVIDWGQQLIDVLFYLHNLKPPHIYRDMKPANIMLMPNGKLKLIDFGLMRLYDPQKTQDTCWLGTYGYAAPEQYGGMGQSDIRTDIYGLGMTMYTFLTSIDVSASHDILRPVRKINSSVSRRMEKVIAKCIEKNPAKRYQNCAELLSALDRC